MQKFYRLLEYTSKKCFDNYLKATVNDRCQGDGIFSISVGDESTKSLENLK